MLNNVRFREFFQILSSGFGGKGKPQVGYPTAMDVFVIICLGSVFAALCEFAILNFISVFMTRYKAEEEKVMQSSKGADQMKAAKEAEEKDQFWKEIEESKDLEDKLQDLTDFLQKNTNATGVYIGRLVYPSKAIEDDDDDFADLDTVAPKVIK